MTKTNNNESWQKLAMFCAVAGLIVNLLMISVQGVPISIALGIFGIAFATLSRKDGEPMPGKAKTALILSIIALVFGGLIFYLTLLTTSTMADPVASRKVIESIKTIKDQLPPEMQQMFENAGIPLE